MKYIEKCPICYSVNYDYNQALMMPFISEFCGIWSPINVNKEAYYDLKLGVSYFSTFSCVCNNCGLVYSKHRFDDSEIKKLYGKYRGSEYNIAREKWEPNYKQTSKYLEQKINHIESINELILYTGGGAKSVLDWGGGDGLNTPMIEYAEQVVSYDISNINGFKILKHENGIIQKFDLISCMHVLEHVNYPMETIKELMQYLNVSGLVYIEVPKEKGIDFNNGGYELDYQKKHWHEHINCFTKKSIEILMEKSNLKILYLSTLDVSDGYREFEVIQCLAKNI